MASTDAPATQVLMGHGPSNQWPLQVPQLQVLYHMKIIFWGVYHISLYSPYIDLIYEYIYSHPEVDRISEIFKKDFFKKKINSWNIFKTLSFYTFFVFVKSFLASFGHGSGEILKNTKIKQHQKIDRILFQTR